MDSHLLYTVTKRLLFHVVWKETDDAGWIYCGLSSDLKRDLLEESINSHFQNEKIYFVLDRKQTCELDISNAIATIASNIDERDFALWSIDFKKVMSFNKIGIFRIGTCTVNQNIK
jgi:hypothetical protein